MFGMGMNSGYSVMYYAVVVIALVFVASYLFGVWKKYSMDFQNSLDENKEIPAWTTPAVRTVIVVAIFILACTWGWNMKQSMTANVSTYENPDEKADQKSVSETSLPANEELDRVRAEQKVRANTKPHEEAIDSFSKRMREEAEKIRKRSIETSK